MQVVIVKELFNPEHSLCLIISRHMILSFICLCVSLFFFPFCFLPFIFLSFLSGLGFDLFSDVDRLNAITGFLSDSQVFEKVN